MPPAMTQSVTTRYNKSMIKEIMAKGLDTFQKHIKPKSRERATRLKFDHKVDFYDSPIEYSGEVLWIVF